MLLQSFRLKKYVTGDNVVQKLDILSRLLRHLYLYKSSLGAREAWKKTEKDINICF